MVMFFEKALLKTLLLLKLKVLRVLAHSPVLEKSSKLTEWGM
jgi:hypothetical protein